MEKIKLSAEQSHKLIVASDEALYASKYAADLPSKVAFKHLTKDEFAAEVNSICEQLDLAEHNLIDVASSIVGLSTNYDPTQLQKAIKDIYWQGYEDGQSDAKKDDKEEPKHD